MRILSILCLGLFLGFSGFASETVKGAQKDYESFKKSMATKLDVADQQISELRAKAKTKGNETQAKLADDLEATKNKLKKEQENLKYESESGWKNLKKSLSEAADKLNDKIQKAMKD